MAVKIRLMRMGKKKQPTYRVVVVDGRRPRDGRYIEAIGRYDPRQEPSVIEIDNERAADWLSKGAQPTDRARKLLEISGAISSLKVRRGEIHTVGASSPVEQSAVAVADATADEAGGSEPEEAPESEATSESVASESESETDSDE